ncbi:PhnA domain-containing protein [Falsihalocynthiibacter sp. SS001]|uniref:PhnA domain-containing protein n=1 Tax=Falsihalocynthiibacter sp. SS001 TaxID=3349698 RepID=UPI0036D43B68
MPLSALTARSSDQCELCGTSEHLAQYDVGPNADNTVHMSAHLCSKCREQIDGELDPHHWRCLTSAMWSEHAPVKVLVWRLLDRLRDEAWAHDLFDMLYLDQETLDWAKAGAEQPALVHKDSNGNVLSAGDTVTLVKALPVKGAGFTAKQGTAVRNISLVADNEEQIEGRVEGQRIVILTKFVKKS